MSGTGLIETLITAGVSALTAAGIVAGILHASRNTRLAQLKEEREALEQKRKEAADTLQAAADAAAELKLREQEIKNDDRAATADLLANLTSAYDQHAHTLGAHIASLESRVRDLEQIVNDRDSAIRDRDNTIRRLRDHVHMANNELAKAGLEKYIREPGEIVRDATAVAPERRLPPMPEPPTQEC